MVEPRREELLIYDHESKNQRGIFHKLDDQYDVSVTFEDDLTNLGSVSSTKDVVAICGVQNKDHISDIDSCLNNDTPIIGVTKQEEIADHMLSEGFDEYLLYGDTETDLAVKGLHRRFQLLKKTNILPKE